MDREAAPAKAALAKAAGAKGFMVYTKREALERYSAVRQAIYQRLRAEDAVRHVSQKLRENRRERMVLDLHPVEAECGDKEWVSSSSFIGISDSGLEELLTLPRHQEAGGSVPASTASRPGSSPDSGPGPGSGHSQRSRHLICDSESDSEEGSASAGNDSEGDGGGDGESVYSDLEEALSSSTLCSEEVKEEKSGSAVPKRKLEDSAAMDEDSLEAAAMFSAAGIDRVKHSKRFQWN